MTINFVYNLDDIPAEDTKFPFKMIFMKLLFFFNFLRLNISFKNALSFISCPLYIFMLSLLSGGTILTCLPKVGSILKLNKRIES